MTTQSSTTTYTPPPELVAAAEQLLAGATPEERSLSDKLYLAYGSVTGQRSAVTGAELPAFEACRSLIQAGWIAAMREARALFRPTPTSLGTYCITIDNSESEAAIARLESRTEALVANLEKAAELMDKLDTLEGASKEDKTAGPTASMTLTAWTPEAGAAVVNLAQGRVGDLRNTGVPLVDTINISEDRIDPFLLGISEIASATRDLAEATRTVGGDDDAVTALIEDVTKALHSRVRALAAPPTEPAANA